MAKNPHAVALGSIKTARKAQSSAANGRKGGRPKREMIPNTVYDVSYRTRDLGHGEREQDTIEAFWTGEIDTWGKLTIRSTDGQTMYLFRDEIVAFQ